ncbi:unnamed protein product [Darwinula stevensoni]|uniref:LEM domain-containing protein n=1 Tax=Darwinula stevensoni TaxID=69355 RepID=A0A7R9A7H7_9CRUS|nr:unnamed protein product [Darwinula stevensoni]CAG0893422.1 unnamed protein product [Darwinula stevensoni]
MHGKREDSIYLEELRRALILYGDAPGPVTSTTKSLYEKRLLRLQQQGNPLRISSESALRASSKTREKKKDWIDSDELREALICGDPPGTVTSTTKSVFEKRLLRLQQQGKPVEVSAESALKKSSKPCEKDSADSDSDELRRALILYGDTPGPITASTKPLYEKRLLRLQQQGNPFRAPSGPALKKSPKPCEGEESIHLDELREALILFGDTPGPVTSATKSLYEKRLLRFQRLGDPPKITTEAVVKVSPRFPEELSTALKDVSLLDEARLSRLEAEMVSEFQRPARDANWREGIVKSTFTYLLLDPRLTRDLPAQTHLDETNKFRAFVSSVFYVGKGRHSRPYSHFYETLRATEKKHEVSEKLKRIQEIWTSGFGVVILHIFLSVIPVEAYTREAVMIDAIGSFQFSSFFSVFLQGFSLEWGF